MKTRRRSFMRAPDDVRQHSPDLSAPAWPAVVGTQTAAVACVAALLALAHVARVPFSHVSRDPATALGGPFVTGYLSYLGACLWCAAAAVALFSAALARGGGDRWASFFLATGLLSALL